MANYEALRTIFQHSNEELQHIVSFLQDREDLSNPTTVLIGGWAVDSYNPWYGSIDIDLITNSRTRNSLKNHLVANRGFARTRHWDDTKRVEKMIEPGKAIIIDFGTREQEDPFEGQDCCINYGILDGQTELRQIRGGVRFPVPKRTVLLLFKLKAAWDRNYRIVHGTSHDAEWERGKLTKDRADILALLDRNRGGQEVDLSFLGEKMEKYAFLKGCLHEVAHDIDAVGRYERMSPEEAEELIERVLSMIE